MICVGKICKPYGVRGLVKIQTYTSSVNSFINFKRFYLINSSLIKFTQLKINSCGNLIGQVSGVYSRTEADNLKNKEIYVNKSDLPKLPPDEFYQNDLVGINVISNKLLGKVVGVFDYGAGAFLEIKQNNNKTATIPFNSKAILNIDLDNRLIAIDKNFLLI